LGKAEERRACDAQAFILDTFHSHMDLVLPFLKS
jgi:hypothetical protein